MIISTKINGCYRVNKKKNYDLRGSFQNHTVKNFKK